MRCCITSRTQVRSKHPSKDEEAFDSQQLPQIPDTPIAGGGSSDRITFRDPVVRRSLVSSTPH